MCPNQYEKHDFVRNFKGYEFDVGIHYIGEVGPGRLNKTLIEQISDGQIEWKKMEDAYDIGKKMFVHLIKQIHTKLSRLSNIK